MMSNEDSKIVFIETNFEAVIVNIIRQCPMEYGGMGGAIGLKYEALKDFIRWSAPTDYDLDNIYAEYVPLINSLGGFYASILNRNKSK